MSRLQEDRVFLFKFGKADQGRGLGRLNTREFAEVWKDWDINRVIGYQKDLIRLIGKDSMLWNNIAYNHREESKSVSYGRTREMSSKFAHTAQNVAVCLNVVQFSRGFGSGTISLRDVSRLTALLSNSLTKVPVNAVKQSSLRAATSISTDKGAFTSTERGHNFDDTCNSQNSMELDASMNRTKRGNSQYTLQDQGIFDSGCSRHMTGNKSFLTDYQEIDGGFVAFRESPKGGKITGKGKIRTRKLDFEDVYFVKELKFNLFFCLTNVIVQENSVLFTETECLVLSLDFKLLDEVKFELKSLDRTTCTSSKDAVANDAGKKTNEEPANKGERSGQEKEGGASNKEDDQNVQDFRVALDNFTAGQIFTNADDLPTDPLMPGLEDTTDLLNTGIFSGAYDDEDVGAEVDLNNLETTMNVSPIPITRIYKDHPKD
ncbi:hypothetical protein Tco_1033254 [Tanacetum coccineum]|uniref:Retrovirus-related Pol polyprotein from transposon TNT 1-94-like beta-barrel domain-containing protein n=1 Tax=Tanacetum coccineum TaxID=301880 RepID=A0ABQ5GF37_9ASTR